MEKTLERVIKNNNDGLFLLDPPTGFGKTTAVVNLIRRFLKGDSIFSNVKKIFFVTNLITNLPWKELINQFTDEERSQCFQAKATIDYVIDRFLETRIENAEVKSSKEYKTLYKEIDTYHSIEKALDVNGTNVGLKNSLNILKQKIATDSEPAFRRFIKASFLFNKSILERKEFLETNGWFRHLYPICDIEKYKVIFLTTQKFISPIETFRRLPFYTYCDEITKNSIVFIDEFDSTKSVVLNQIVEDGLKNQIDIVGLFLDLHFALQNVTLPKSILKTTDYNKEKVERGEWYSSENHFKYWKAKFKEIYEKHNINYLIKSVDFEYDKAFLFDDGKYFNVVKDSSKKFIYAHVSPQDDLLTLRGAEYNSDAKSINQIIRDLEACIDGFAQAIFYVYNNYLYFKNTGKKSYETKYTPEEALYSVLDVLNLSQIQKDYLFSKIQKGDYLFDKTESDPEMRRGFNFTEIEDSNYHDMKSVVHCYRFPTTPEDIIIRLSNNALVVGISATANIETCIGNYDLKYIKKKLQGKLINIWLDDEERIIEKFNSMINQSKGQYQINARIIDDFNSFSYIEKCKNIIDLIFDEERRLKYNRILDEKNTKGYYFFLELKLTLIYKEICEKGIQSFIAFENRFPRPNEDFDLNRLLGLFEDLCSQYNFEPVRFEVVESSNFDDKFISIEDDLAKGKQVFVLSTYQTIGSGKNIQYPVPADAQSRVVQAIDDSSGKKDFEGIYLATPTNLMQILRYNSEDKYADLAKYLFQQEYLYQNKHLSYYQMKQNIANGFRQTFFSESNGFYSKNGDLYAHTFKIAIQAVGRICRCRSKNKNIYVFADREVVERIQTARQTNAPKLLNEEFKALLQLRIDNTLISNKLKTYSDQSKKAYTKIKKAAFTVRRSYEDVHKWQEIRDFVLKNPTANNPGQYKEFYFEFDEKYSGFSFKQNQRYDITEMRMSEVYDLQQVSEQACDLPTIMAIGSVEKMFREIGYARRFNRANYIMSPSLFKQIYLGALGEVVGKFLMEEYLGWELKELADISFYEYFDFQLGNIYFDFKHWNEFRVDNDKYVQKVEGKLKKIKGAKCFVINLVKRSEALPKINMGETVVQIPYLIDGERGTINEEAIEYIGQLYDEIKTN